MIRYFNLFLFIYCLLITGCGSSSNVQENNLNSLNLEVNLADENSSYHTITLSGFNQEIQNQYDEAVQKLETLSPEDVKKIDQSADQIAATIKDDPISYNRVLWALGSEHFKEHSTDYESPEPTGSERDKMPELKGGIEAVMSEVTYPDALNGIEGRVMVELIVTRFGEVSEPAVVQSLHYAADREAIRVVNRMKFSPGVLDGLPVKVKYTLPVFFREP